MTFGPPVITVDVEDWPQSTWDRDLPITERAARNTRHLLELLDRLGVRTTMFVLGKLADAFPEVVREIHAAGHEVACHGQGHVEVFDLDQARFAADVRQAKDRLEQLIGQPVRGYRAPDFSIVRRSLWGLDVLAEVGFSYDSSIFPVARPRYGIPDWPREPRRVRLPSGQSIVELPIASFVWRGKNWPVGGGGYHRLLPGWLSRQLVARVLREQPFVFYCHPYEFDPREFAEIPWDIPWKTRLHQGLGRGRFEGRFVRLVRRFGSQRCADLLRTHEWPAMDLPAVASNN